MIFEVGLALAHGSWNPAGSDLDGLPVAFEIINGLAASDFTYDPATLALDKEAITYTLPNQPAFTRILDRSQDALARPTGYSLGSAGVPPTSGGILPPPEAQATYGYSPTTGRLETVSNGTSSFRYDYLANSSLIEHVVATAGAVHDVHLTYEPTRNVLASRQNKVGTTVISQYDYTVNSLGQRSAVAQVGTAFQAVRAIAWQYDSLGQVTSADSSENTHDRAYQYDTIGNRLQGSAGVPPASTETTYLPNSLNQYQTITTGGAPLSPAYDFDGNMTSGPLPAAPTANSTLVWDAENRLIETTVGTNGPLVQNYYDSQSRRIATTSGGETTVYVYDSWNCIAEYGSAGVSPASYSLTKTRLWGTDLSGSLQGAGGVGGLLAEKQGANTYFPTFDGNGNVSEYLTSTGAVAAHFEYDPFGNTVVNTDTTNQFAYRFSTKPQDSTTGLYYYGYRFYDPLTGRWPSRDPIEEKGGVNLYGFVINNTIENVDYLGKENCCEKLPAGFNEIFNAVSAALLLAGKNGLPQNPRDWGNLFVSSAGAFKTVQIQSVCHACNGQVMCGKYGSDERVVYRALRVCEAICRLAAELGAHSAETILDLPGPSLK